MENDIKTRSLSELEQLYQRKLEQWSDRRAKYLKKAGECEQQMTLYDQKLRHIKALVGGPEAAAEMPLPVPPVKRSAKRRRHSPIREATLLVLRNRPSQKLTAAQIKTAIRKDTHKRCSRQAVNNAVNVLEEDGLIRRERAPRGSGAQFVFSAV